MTCPKIVESDKTPLEIAPRGDDSPGGSLTSKPLSGGDATDVSEPVNRQVGKPQGSAPPAQPLKLPDPWLFDSEALLRELDRIRETALQVPTNGDANATHFGLQLVINAAWTLRENIRYILGLHREMQASVRKKHKTGTEAQHQTIYEILCLFVNNPCTL